MERARGAGVEDRVRQVVGKDWDAESFQEFVSNDSVRNDLLDHIETGAYDKVQDKIAEMSRLDYNGSFGSMTTINKYRAAVVELQKEHASSATQQPVVENTAPKKVVKKSTVSAEKAKIDKARQEEEYKEKAAKREAKVAQQRKRAASMSKKKAKVKQSKPKFDPLALEGEELEAHMNFLITGGRG
jgi:hypothetical protein